MRTGPWNHRSSTSAGCQDRTWGHPSSGARLSTKVAFAGAGARAAASVQRRGRPRLLLFQLVGEHGLLDRRELFVEILLRDNDDWHKYLLGRLLALEMVEHCLRRPHAHEVGLLHARGDDLALSD